MTLQEISTGIFVENSNISEIKNIDGLIFDCDGVLVDITESYDSTIIQTTKYVLENIFNIISKTDVSYKIIEDFKASGGFNDEVDVTYACILSFFAAEKLSKDYLNFINLVIENSDSTGIKSVEKYIEKQIDIFQIKEKLAYPGNHDENILYRIFDQIFYGPELYKTIFNKESNFLDSGFIEKDKLILSEQLLEKFEKKFNKKLALVTGRGFQSVRYTLKNLLEKFDIKNSRFLEDESRELAKPNPIPLQNTIQKIQSTTPLYIGDSMEDLIMAKQLKKDGNLVFFCGITGTSKHPKEKLTLFEKNEADLILNSIDDLPKVLNLD